MTQQHNNPWDNNNFTAPELNLPEEDLAQVNTQHTPSHVTENTVKQDDDVLVNPEDIKEEDELVPPDDVIPQAENDVPNTSSQPDDEKSSVKLVDFKLVNNNVTMQEPVRAPYVKDEKNTQVPVYFTPTTHRELDFIGNSDFVSRNSNDMPLDYRIALRDGTDILQSNDAILKSVENKDADYKQYVERVEGLIRPFRPKWKNGSNQTLSGLKAIDKIRNALNQGSTLTIPLWASGVWLTLKAPTTMDLADNFDMISNEIIELGKQTAGGIFENTQVTLNKHLMDLTEKLFYSWSLNDAGGIQDSRSLSEVILVDDLETIAWAISVCMFPNGYPFTEPCVSNMETCNAISTELINLSKIYWVDQNKLTPWQIEFMSNPTVKRSYDEVMKYRSEAKWAKTNKIRLGDYPFSIYLKTPTAQEHIDAGYRWINSLRDSVRDVVANANDSKLNSMIFERAGLTIVRGYAHYVDAIVYDDGSRTKDVEDIEESINEICAVPEAVSQLVDKINEHITNSTITMTAIPRHICPHCKQDVNEDDQRHPYLIPISALKLFFSLRDRRLQLE